MVETVEKIKRIVEPMKFMTAAEVRAIPPDDTRFILDGMLPGSGSSIFVAIAKTGKSTFCHQLALSVAHGTPFLCRATIQGDVLYITIEEKASEFFIHMDELGMTDATPVFTNFNIACEQRDLIESLELAIGLHPNTRLIVIDPLFKFLHIPDASDYADISRKVKPIHDLARRHKLHILTVHHCKKRSSDNVVLNALGSGALTGAVDSVLVMTRNRNGERILQTEQRYGDSMEPTALRWNKETHSISIGSTLEELDAERETSFEKAIENKIVQFVAKNPGCTQEDIWDGIPHKTVKVKAAFKLIRRTRLEEKCTGARGEAFRYYIPEITTEDRPSNEKRIPEFAEQIGLEKVPA